MNRFQFVFFVTFAFIILIGFNITGIIDPAFFESGRRYDIVLNLLGLMFLVSIFFLDNQFTQNLSLLKRENEKLHLSLADHVRESLLLTTLNEIIEVFGRRPDLDTVLNRIAEASQRLVKADNLILQVYSSEKRPYFTMVIKGREEIALGEKVIDDIIFSGSSALINNTNVFSQYRFLSERGYQSFLAAPLKYRGESIGLLAALGERQNAFTSRDLDLMTALATQAGLLVENATLLEKTKLLSITDGLTNLFNRRYFEDLFRKVIDESAKKGTPCSVAMLDVDYFKVYNDTHGHLAGDEVLREISRILQKGTKGSDTVARYGGEEFVIVFPDTNLTNAVLVCSRLNQAIADHIFPGEKSQPDGDLTISIGVAAYPADGGVSADDVLEQADSFLYQAKNQGRNRVIYSAV